MGINFSGVKFWSIESMQLIYAAIVRLGSVYFMYKNHEKLDRWEKP